MRRSDRKRARLTVQPRLTAFLQPAERAQASRQQSTYNASLKLPASAATNDQIGDIATGQQATLGWNSKGLGTGPIVGQDSRIDFTLACDHKSDGRDEEQRQLPLQSNFVALKNQVHAFKAEQAVTSSSTDTKPANGKSEPLSNAAHRQYLAGKGSLAAFVKRQRLPVLGEASGQQDVEKVNAKRAAFGRTVHGSAYAQCPMCTVRTESNH
jgi:hypothetical protein